MKAAETYLNCKQAFAAAKSVKHTNWFDNQINEIHPWLFFFFLPSFRCYEQSSIILYKEMDNVEEAVKLIEKACRLYREHGVPDTAAITYDRTAKSVILIKI